jgi:2-polyprenyl-6-methoxyphenol hydroxylase-like FAD-dependent oxidoreductase
MFASVANCPLMSAPICVSLSNMTSSADLSDVVVVGAGPVGMATAAMLAKQGHAVTVLERHLTAYGKPRAATFDHEAARDLQRLGCLDQVLETSVAQTSYEWVNGAGERLLEIRPKEDGPLGWAEVYLMYQPALEQALHEVLRRSPRVRLLRGAEVVALADLESTPVVVTQDRTTGQTFEHRCRYVLGCDGGSSFVRKTLDISLQDFGFDRDWLVFDFLPRHHLDLPLCQQRCEPGQPTAIMQLGTRHRRWSFMLLPGESPDEALREENVWKRLAPWIGPNDVTITRLANYTFHSTLAETWRAGSVFLAGDAAHQMPPFLGQGMCSGFRDARNIAWKLDLVLRGLAGTELLDTYEQERKPHVQAITERAIELGRIQTLNDPVAARIRDAKMIEAQQDGNVGDDQPYPPLTAGLLASRDGSLSTAAGELFIQAAVATSDARGLFDNIVGASFVVLCRAGDPRRVLSARQHAAWAKIGGQLTTFDEGVETNGSLLALKDVEGAYGRWFTDRHAAAVLVRPDFQVFGAVSELDELPRLVDELLDRLAGNR